ncbi:TetR/AcrR family transcriptional regulator [Ornithinibacillus bavariensis]|uniref:TetR family transcriptional regulator n=1 Tax=Ornithinibacillus bavariensis TaxID=545502 RepID=A0A919X4N4_9BACI|nr:TetR/AcrR family transcriptional regulator [Ornithinibacillus bavariensis]GIO25441.1 TetR family transcriptional regulator [Ornithinibacillus bavariensis]HAM80545.1 TetR/AcrR family transcriptional regulator [Ornithinibacillus sp.]
MKKDLRIVKTQASLRHALLALLKTKPLEAITIAELCRLANINRGTFYLHYKDVHDVFKHYLEVIVNDLKQSYEEPIFKTNYNIENIQADMIKIFHHVKKYQDFYQIIFDERIPMMYYYLFFDTVRSFMKDSLTNEIFIKEQAIDIDYLISYQTNAIIGIIIEWHKEGYKTSFQELNQQLIAILSIHSPFRERMKEDEIWKKS